MKKWLVLVVVMTLVCGNCFASDVARKVYSYGLKNASGVQLVTVIPVASIRPNVDKIVGYSIIPLTSATAELYVSLFDGTTKSLAGEVLAENEATTGLGISEFWPTGKWIYDGVVVSQGANTMVQVYFVRE